MERDGKANKPVLTHVSLVHSSICLEFYYMPIIYALMVFFFTMLVTTIPILYNLIIQLFTYVF